ncbi:MAG: glycosyl hydrolase [Fimbriimonadales bacterium]
MGDAAYCAGINRFVLHRFVQQPWDDRYLPGATMGQWGTHFDRTQTWWKFIKPLVQYWQRCQALLQWGKIAPLGFHAEGSPVRAIHRHGDAADVWFVANLERTAGEAQCSFKATGKQPELWDPVTGEVRELPDFKDDGTETTLALEFAPSQSWFVVFRKPGKPSPGSNFPTLNPVGEVTGSWDVSFDPKWGGPAAVKFEKLEDWTTRPEPGIRYYSGTAIYRTTFDGANATRLDLGVVNNIARVKLNERDLGIVWTAPWSVSIPAGLLRAKGNQLEVEIANTWRNRLIGDEQEPSDCEWLPGHMGNGGFLKQFPDWFVKGQPRPSIGRYCFTTWNYFTKDSQLAPSGLLGPVRLMNSR